MRFYVLATIESLFPSSFNIIATMIKVVPSHCTSVMDSESMILAEMIATGNSNELNIFARPPEIKCAPSAKNKGGSTDPTKATPAVTNHKSPSVTGIDGISFMKIKITKTVDPVIIRELRTHGSTSVATFPLKLINPAYVKAARIPNIKPNAGNVSRLPFKILEAKNTPIRIRTIADNVMTDGFILVRIHSSKMPIQTN